MTESKGDLKLDTLELDDYEEILMTELDGAIDDIEGFVALDGRGPSKAERERARKTEAFLRSFMLGISDPGQTAQVLHDIGSLLGRTLESPDEALSACREAFQRQPTAIHIVRGYRKALLRSNAPATELVAALEAEARTTTHDAYSAPLELARGLLLEHELDNVQAARGAYEAALAADSGYIPALKALERLAVARGSADEAAAYAQRIAESITDPRIRGEHQARAARHLEVAGNLDGAQAQAATAKIGALTSPAVSFVLERLYSRTGQFKELVALREAQIEDGAVDAAAGWFEIGLLRRYRLDDRDGAIEAFEKTAELTKGDATSRLAALRELAPLFREAERWERLADIEALRAIDEPDGVARAAAWHRRGLIYERHLGDEDQALSSYQRALEEDQGYSPALEGAGRLYASRGSTEELIAMHLLEAEVRTNPVEQAGALRRAGQLLIETESRRQEGLDALQRAIQLNPDDYATGALLERAMVLEKDWKGLASIYQKQLEGNLDPTRRGMLLRQLANLASEHLGDRPLAISALREMAKLETVATPPPEHLTKLAQLLEEEGDLDGLAETLDQLIRRTTEASQAASQLERLANVHERRGDLEAAVDAYLRALEFAPPSHGVMVSAARAFLRTERYEELADLFLQASGEGSARDQARWLHKAAEVLAQNLGDTERAIDTLRQALSLAPDHIPARGALEELLIDLQRWDELRELLDAAATDKAMLLRQGILAEITGDVAAATEYYAQATDAGLPIAALPLYRVLAEAEEWRTLYERYGAADQRAFDLRHALYRGAEVALERLGERSAAAQMLFEVLEREPDDVTAIVSLVEAGIAPPARARDLLQKLIASTDDSNVKLAGLTEIQILLSAMPPSDEVLAARLELIEQGLLDPLVTVAVELDLESRGDRKQLVDVYRRLVASPSLDPRLVADIQARLAELLEELGAIQQATDALEASIAARQGAPSLASRIALTRLFGALGDYARYADSLAELSSILPPGPERATTLRLLATQREQLAAQDPDLAIAALEAALKDNPRDYPSLTLLHDLLEGRGEHSRLLHHLLRAFSAEEEPEQVATIGTLLANKLIEANRLEQALEVLDRFLAVVPNDLEALKLLTEVHRRSGAWGAAAQRLRQIADHEEAPSELRLQALWYLATILVERLDDVEAAREVASRLAAEPADDPASLARVLAVQELVGDHASAAETLQKLANDESTSPKDRAAYLLQLGRIQEESLGDPDAALETLAAIDSKEHQLAALQRVLRLAEATERWEPAADAIRRVFEQGHQLEPSIELRLRRRLASLLDGPLERSKEAIPHYERIAELEPTDIRTLTHLAELSFDGDPIKAIAHHRTLLELKPNRIPSYRALRQLLLRAEEEDEVFCVEAVLDGLGTANEEESYFYAQRRSRLGGRLDGSISEHEWKVICPEFDEPPLALLRAITPALDQVFPVDVDSFSLADDEGIGRSIDESARQVAEVFGISSYKVVISPPRIGPTVLGGDPLTLLIPRHVTEGLPREQLFVCGALFGRARTGGILGDPHQLHRVTDQQLKYLIWSACELVVPSYEAPTIRNAILEDIKSRLSKALPDDHVASLADAARQLAESGNDDIDTAALKSAMNRAAARAGTLTAIDPALAMSCLRQWRAMFSAKPDELDDHGMTPEGWAGPVFAVSATYRAIRERLGMGVRP